MDFLRISETKMKITLDQSDLERFRVAASALDYEDPATRRAFRAILDAARSESGFDVAGGKALIQCYPCKDGGCELFVTKLGAFPEVTERAISRVGRAAMLSFGKSIYYFSSFSDLLCAVRAVSAVGEVRLGDVYAGEDGGYYLVMDELGAFEGKNGKPSVSAVTAFLEFGRPFMPKGSGSAACLYINEHARKLTEGNTLLLLSRL